MTRNQVERRIALNNHHPAEALIALRNLQALEEQLAEKRFQQEGISVLAPVAGQVVASR